MNCRIRTYWFGKSTVPYDGSHGVVFLTAVNDDNHRLRDHLESKIIILHLLCVNTLFWVKEAMPCSYEMTSWNNGANLYPVRSVTACDCDLWREQNGKFLLRHRLRSLSVCSLDSLDTLSIKKINYLLAKLWDHETWGANRRPGCTIFLKVAHVLLVAVLCSRMTELLIRSPTLSLWNIDVSVNVSCKCISCSLTCDLPM